MKKAGLRPCPILRLKVRETISLWGRQSASSSPTRYSASRPTSMTTIRKPPHKQTCPFR